MFLGLGLAGVNALGIAEPHAAGLRAAVDFIAELRQATDYSKVPVGRRVVVIGGGMTAVDAAVQSRLLGAEEVTIVYRRGPEGMSASGHEQDWAQTHGVKIRHWAAPKEVLAEGGAVSGVRFAATRAARRQVWSRPASSSRCRPTWCSRPSARPTSRNRRTPRSR